MRNQGVDCIARSSFNSSIAHIVALAAQHRIVAKNKRR